MKAYSFRGRAWRPKRQLALAAIPLRLAVDVYASSFEGVLRSLTHSITLHANTLSFNYFFCFAISRGFPHHLPNTNYAADPANFQSTGNLLWRYFCQTPNTALESRLRRRIAIDRWCLIDRIPTMFLL